MVATVSANDDTAVKARELFSSWTRWSPSVEKATGRPFFIIPGSSKQAYYTNQHDCTCQDRTYRRRVCKHMLAVRLWLKAYLAGEITATRITGRERAAMLEPLVAQERERHARETAAAAVEEDWSVYDREIAAEGPVEADSPLLADLPTTATDPAPVRTWKRPAGAPVWLEEGDTWEPDASGQAGDPLSRPDPRDRQRHARHQTHSPAYARSASPRAVVGRPPVRGYRDLYPEDD